MAIDDSGYTPTYTGAFNFMNGASQSNEYTYDKNGNLTKDLNKNISSIQYNFLNLPANITYSSGKSAAYIYDANGQKLRTSYKASASATAVPTDYCGNMIYENGVLKQILVDGGYMTVTGTPFYFYYLKNHLGSNRVVVSPAGTATQINHYYPFGGLFGESTGNTGQRYKYNGKEFDRTHGLDWYDYGARHMSPDVGRFTTIDPMAEKYYSISPYAYCANNPVNYIDLRGDSLTLIGEQNDINKTTDIYNKGLGGYYNVKADKIGLVSISRNNDLDSNNMTESERLYYNNLNMIIGNKNMIKMSVLHDNNNVIIGDIYSRSIDISDISALNGYINTSSETALLHETVENSLVQDPTFRSNDIYRIAKAHGSAEAIEHYYSGNYNINNIFDLNLQNSGSLIFMQNGNPIERIPILNGNVIKK